VREKYCWLVAGGWFVLREKYCWLVADKPNEQGTIVMPKADGGAVPQVDLGTSPEQWEQLAHDHPGRSVEAVCVAQVTTNADVDR
jgi:hypothetical protein